MEERRVRICDLAEELGLSTATVSNVIHGKTQKVSDATVQRVTALLEEREYIPNMAGILLAQNDSRIIGVFVNDHEKYEGRTLSDFFIAESLNELSTQIEKTGRFMMVKKAKDAGQILRFASMWNMEGIVVIGFCAQDYQTLRNHMRIPFVVYDGICGQTERIVNLSIDNSGGGEQVGRHFRALGHTRALCLSDNETGIDRDRIEGFFRGFAPGHAELLRIPMQKETAKPMEQGILRFIVGLARWLNLSVVAEGVETREQLERLRGVTAVFAVSDHYAIDLMSFLRGQGIAVPEEISVAGFDDTPVCEMVSPALTTVRQDGAARARIAMEKLQALREGRTVGEEVILPVTLVVRGSTRIRK